MYDMMVDAAQKGDKDSKLIYREQSENYSSIIDDSTNIELRLSDI